MESAGPDRLSGMRMCRKNVVLMPRAGLSVCFVKTPGLVYVGGEQMVGAIESILLTIHPV